MKHLKPSHRYSKKNNMNLFGIRKEYRLHALDEKMVDNPFRLFDIWLREAIEGKVNEPTAMTLATSTPDGFPSARIVLLKSFSEGEFFFFSNYLSRKGCELEANNRAALLLFWPELERQIRIEGVVGRTSAAVSDEYFNSRPYDSRISAIVSPQSQPVADRQTLEQLWLQKLNENNGNNLKRPDYWGGFALVPEKMEFWQGRPNRLHDRILFSKEKGIWKISRLAP
jgi:pyridoxamine 5'-phosphate oxidase